MLNAFCRGCIDKVCKTLERPRMPSVEDHDDFYAFSKRVETNKELKDLLRYKRIQRQIAQIE